MEAFAELRNDMNKLKEERNLGSGGGVNVTATRGGTERRPDVPYCLAQNRQQGFLGFLQLHLNIASLVMIVTLRR